LTTISEHVSTVVKRREQSGHWRRLRIDVPSSVVRLSMRKGFLRRDPHRPRAYEVRGSDQAASAQPTDTAGKPAASYVPLVARIAIGGPILAEESVEDVFRRPQQLVVDGELFVLKLERRRVPAHAA
jgi:SOS-response transcriptional repressor LexA